MAYNNVIISGTGSFIPENIVSNSKFAAEKFYDEDGEPFEASHEEITEKFVSITGIEERRWADNEMDASEMGAIAAQKAIDDAGIDKETIDQIIVAHNFGDVKHGTIQTDMLPSHGSRIKQKLGIENPACVAYDLIFGCPGWVQGVIHAYSFINSGVAKRCLVVANETLSRVVDLHDRDAMIFADGAGAAVVEADNSDKQEGLLSFSQATYAIDEAKYLFLGKSNIKDANPNVRYIKMLGRKIYEFALNKVPLAMKEAMDKAGADIHDLKKIFIHQANEKMDYEIVKRFYRLYRERNIPEHIMPMSIHKLGNSSVSTVPTLFDMVKRGECEYSSRNNNDTEQGYHELKKGDLIMFASVGAGMNINAVVYRY